MIQYTISLKDIYEIEGKPLPPNVNVDSLGVELGMKYRFLPPPVIICLDGDSISVSHPDEPEKDKIKAAQLSDRAAEFARAGDCAQAVRLWRRALRHEPSRHVARRDLAMACYHLGDIGNARHHVLNVLRVDPADVESLVFLANLWLEFGPEYGQAERLARRALAVDPQNPYALHCLGAVLFKAGRVSEAKDQFSRAIAAAPAVPYPYNVVAHILLNEDRPEQAQAILQEFFAKAELQDVRSQPFFNQSRDTYVVVQEQLARKQHGQSCQIAEDLRRETERYCSFPIQFVNDVTVEGDGLQVLMSSNIKWDPHVIQCSASYPELLRPHLRAQGLLWIRHLHDAAKAGQERSLAFTPRSRDFLLGMCTDHVRRLAKRGCEQRKLWETMEWLAHWPMRWMFNLPLTMLVEARLKQERPALSAVQFLALRRYEKGNRERIDSPRVREIMPPHLLRISVVLFGALALYLDSLFGGATDLAANYRNRDGFELSQKLWAHWQARFPALKPGDEYALVDEFAELLGLRGAYEWHRHSGASQTTA